MKTLSSLIVIFLVLHGLIHLMGTITYMKLGVVQGLTYKTTLLGGKWDLGADGTRVYGALRGVAAIGFIVAAAALLFGWSWWRPVLFGVALLSLMLTGLDWKDASVGGIFNLAILAWVGLAPYMMK